MLEMRKLIFIFVFCCGCGNANAGVIVSSDIVGGAKTWNENVTIYENAVVMPDNINVNRTINVENHGRIESDIYVADNRDLFVKNTGVWNSDVFLGNGAKLYQVISNSEQITNLNLTANYTVVVDANDEIVLADVIDVASNADLIVLSGGVFDINGFIDVYGGCLELRNEIVLKIDSLDSLYNDVLMDNVVGDGGVRFETMSTDILFADVGMIRDGNLYVVKVRETDYGKILKNDTGNFLNVLRTNNPNSKLLDKLDAASDMNEINRILDKSVRFNADMLIQPMRILNFDSGVSGVKFSNAGVRFNIVGTDDFDMYSTDISIGIKLSDKLDFAIGANFGILDFAGKVDDFNANVYGINIGVNYSYDENWSVMGRVAVNKMDTDLDRGLYSGRDYASPSVIGGWAKVDFGYRVGMFDNGWIMPIIGVGAEGYKVADINIADAFVRAGVTAGYDFHMIGIDYNYYGKIESTADYGYVVSVGMGFWSHYDGAGGFAELTTIHAFDTNACKVSVGARVLF